MLILMYPAPGRSLGKKRKINTDGAAFSLARRNAPPDAVILAWPPSLEGPGWRRDFNDRSHQKTDTRLQRGWDADWG